MTTWLFTTPVPMDGLAVRRTINGVARVVLELPPGTDLQALMNHACATFGNALLDQRGRPLQGAR